MINKAVYTSIKSMLEESYQQILKDPTDVQGYFFMMKGVYTAYINKMMFPDNGWYIQNIEEKLILLQKDVNLRQKVQYHAMMSTEINPDKMHIFAGVTEKVGENGIAFIGPTYEIKDMKDPNNPILSMKSDQVLIMEYNYLNKVN